MADKIDRSAVMRAAWAECRRRRMFNGKFIFGPNGRRAFAGFLRKAWHDAKAAAGLLTPAEIARDELAERIRYEIEMLKFKSFHINIEPRRRALEQQLASLGV